MSVEQIKRIEWVDYAKSRCHICCGNVAYLFLGIIHNVYECVCNAVFFLYFGIPFLIC